MSSTICLAEDREACEPALRLLLLSLNAHCSEVAINLFYPPASESFLIWIKRCPQVQLQKIQPAKGYGWNIKPRAIMHMMDEGFDEVIWIDSDIIVTRNPRQVFAPLESNVLVATEDALGDDRHDRNALRARLWGFPVGRALPFGLNSGVLRVTTHHYHLMERWWQLLQSDTYQEFQRREWRQRPVHMLGDQDVLTALVTSKEFSEIPLHILRRGKHILQFNGVYGYTLAERMRNLLGECPLFIHSFAGKPWSERWRDSSFNLREYLKKVYLDLSPYTLSAMRFRRDLECDTEWMQPHYVLSRILRTLGMGCPALVGLPIAAFMDGVRLLKSMRRSQRLNLPVLASGGSAAASK
jgi:Nucleotide-diphospho-sugar transferase